MAIARTHLEENFSHLSVSDWENLINEIPLNDENKLIAKMRFIDEECIFRGAFFYCQSVDTLYNV